MAKMKLSPRRAEMLSVVALVMQLVFFLLTFLVSVQTNSFAVRIEAWHFLGGSLIWSILLLQFHQRRLAQQEKLDAEEYDRLRTEGRDILVFEGTTAEDSLHLAERRLAWLEKYLLEEAGVACLSGTSFGRFGEGYLRFSYANSVEQIQLALERIDAALQKL